MSEPITLDGEDAKVQIGDETYTKEDIENLKAGHDKNAERREVLDVRDKELADTKEKLTKLENKNYNFKKLRDMNDDEKNKLSATEIELKKKQEELEENQNKFQTTVSEGNKNEAIAVLVGDDVEMKKKVLYNYDRILGDAVTKEQINTKMRDAYNMLGVANTSVNPINKAISFQGGVGGVSSANQSAKVNSELAGKLGITDEELKNSNLIKQ